MVTGKKEIFTSIFIVFLLLFGRVFSETDADCYWKTLHLLTVFSNLAQLVGSYLVSCCIHKLHKLRETGKGRERGDSVMFHFSRWIKEEGKENSPTMIPHVYFMTRFLSK